LTTWKLAQAANVFSKRYGCAGKKLNQKIESEVKGARRAQAPMARRQAHREARRVSRRLRLDVVDPEQRQAARRVREAAEGPGDDLGVADRVVHEAPLSRGDPLLPVAHVPAHEAPELWAGGLRPCPRVAGGPRDLRDRQPLEQRAGRGHVREPRGLGTDLHGQQDLLCVIERPVHDSSSGAALVEPFDEDHG
jgi:hypothetical protein